MRSMIPDVQSRIQKILKEQDTNIVAHSKEGKSAMPELALPSFQRQSISPLISFPIALQVILNRYTSYFDKKLQRKRREDT